MRDKIAELFKEFYDKTFAYYYYHNEANLENVTPDQYADQILALFPSLEGQIHCSRCGEGVSSPVPKDTVVRAWVECPECIETGRLKVKEKP